MIDEKFLFSVKDIAKIFDRQERIIYKWITRYNIRKRDSGKYYLPDFIEVYKNIAISTSRGGDLKDELNKKKLERMEFELETLKNKYIERKQIISEWQSMAQSLKQSILVLSVKIAERCAKTKTLASARKVIEEEVLDMFESMHSFAEYMPKLNKKEQKNIIQAFYQFWDKVKKMPHNKKITVNITIK